MDQAGHLFQGVLIARHVAAGVEELSVAFVVIFMTFSFQDPYMKRTTLLILAVSGSLLLGGCVPVWDGGGRHGHDRGYDSGRGYDRGHDDRGYDRGYDRRDNDQRYDSNRDRDDRDD